MHFPNAIPIIIPRPFVDAMLDHRLLAGQIVIALPFIGVDCRFAFGKALHMVQEGRCIGAGNRAQAQLFTLPSDGADNRHQVIGIGAVPFDP
jgi:hypothetical protein